MLTLLLLLWLRKVRNTGETNAAFIRHQLAKIAQFIMAILLILPLTTLAQAKTYSYQVIRNDDQIGTLTIVETQENQRTTLMLDCKIKARMVFTISVRTKEKTILENQRIVYAESTRNVNRNEAVYRKLQSVGDGYRFQAASKQIDFDSTPIFNNTVSLYVSEPVHSLSVFSDAFNQLLQLKRTSEHVYVLDLPDGNRNTYRYKDGVCNEVLVDHQFFTARIVLDKINQE